MKGFSIAGDEGQLDHAKKYDDKFHRENRLVEALIKIEGQNVTIDAFRLLIDLLEESAKNYDSNKNPRNIFYVIFSLLKYSKKEVQVEIINLLIGLCNNDLNLLNYAESGEWLTLVLNSLSKFQDTEILDTIFKFIELLANFNINVKQMRMIFNLFRAKNTQFTSYYWQQIFPLLTKLLHGNAGYPDICFQFSGYKSGIKIPPWKLTSKNLTLFTWVNVLSFSSKFTKNYQPILFSFLGENGRYIEVFWNSNKKIVVHISSENSNSSKKGDFVFDFDFSENQWYFLTFVYKYKMITSDVFTLYVNGTLVQKKYLKFFRYESNFGTCYLGNSAILNEPMHAFKGQISGFCASDFSISRCDIKFLYTFGPNLFSSTHKIKYLFEINKYNVYFFITPYITKDCKGYEPWNGNMDNVSTMFEVTKCKTVTFNTSLFNTGGIKLLLPLFSSKYRPPIGNTVDLNSKIIAFITEITQDNPFYRVQMEQIQFFEIMGYLLANEFEDPSEVNSSAKRLDENSDERENMNTNKWSVESISLIENLLDFAIVPYSTTSTYSNKVINDLHRQFFENIYMNFDIWCKTDFDVHQTLLQKLNKKISSDPEAFHSFISINRLMFILSDYYSYPVEPKRSRQTMHSQNFRHWDGKPKSQLLNLRSIIIEIISTFLKLPSLKLEEVSSIICYIYYEINKKPTDKILVIDIIQALTTLVSVAKSPFIDHMNTLGDIVILLPLLKCEQEIVKVSTLKLIGKFFQQQSSIRESKISFNTFQSSKGGSFAGEKESKISTIDSLSCIREFLEDHPFTKKIYNALLEILLGHVSSFTSVSPVEVSKKNSSASLFKNTSVIPTIFRLINGSPDASMRIQLLKDMLFYFKLDITNREKFISEMNWQSWTLSLVEVPSNFCDSSDCGEEERFMSESDRRCLIELIIEMFALLFQTTFYLPQYAQSVFQTTTAVVNCISVSPNLNIPSFLNDFNTLVFKFITENGIIEESSKKPILFQTIVHYLDFVDHSLFIVVKKGSGCDLSFNKISLFPFEARYCSNVYSSFILAQRTLEIVNLLIQERQNRISWEWERYKPLEEHLCRIRMRLILYLILKGSPFKSSGKLGIYNDSFEEIINIFPNFSTSMQIKESLYRYIDIKASDRKDEVFDANLAFEKNVQTLEEIINDQSLSISPSMHILVFIFSIISMSLDSRYKHSRSINIQSDANNNNNNAAADDDSCGESPPKRSFTEKFETKFPMDSYSPTVESVATSDEGLKCLINLWKVAFTVVKHKLENIEEYKDVFGGLDRDEISQSFQMGMSDPENFELTDNLKMWVEFIVNKDVEDFITYKNSVENYEKQSMISDQNQTIEEGEFFNKLNNQFTSYVQQRISEFQRALNTFRIRRSHAISLIANKWRNMLRVFLDIPGPWNSLFGSQKLYWKLDFSENPQRMHIRLKPCHNDMSLLELASKLNEKKSRDCANTTNFNNNNNNNSTNSINNGYIFKNQKVKFASRIISSFSESNAEISEHDEDTGNLIDMCFDQEQDDYDSSENFYQEQLQSVIPKKLSEERVVLTTTCTYVKGIQTFSGDFEITTLNIHFRNLEQGIFKSIPIEKIRVIYSRLYILKSTAMEFFTNNKSYFFDFDKINLNVIRDAILEQERSNVREHFVGSALNLALKKRHITEAWRKRKISNFEYLMELNTISGRSYNDFTQYPVFPWIIKDYTSEDLDINDPSIYRDLSKPIGALNEDRLKKSLERWEHMVNNFDEFNPPFMYGSHYSTHSIVLFYLIRLEPFTTQAIKLQDGHFDLPARVFSSIEDVWNNIMINPSDLKELIPEFFFLPDFLSNPNNINLGHIKNEVVLPPWAPNPQTFIQMHRMALESEYVSSHLHEWIDLIFGYKQRGPESIEAHNVFHYLSYQGSVDLDSLEVQDPVLKASIQAQIREFGQVPSQLFKTPHPMRIPLEDIQNCDSGGVYSYVANAFGSSSELDSGPKIEDLEKIFLLELRKEIPQINNDIISISVDKKSERFIVVFMDRIVLPVNYKIMNKSKKFPIFISTDLFRTDILQSIKVDDYKLNQMLSPNILPENLHSSFDLANDGRTFFNGSNWDLSICVSDISSNGLSLQKILYGHKDIVTCLKVSQDGSILCTGSKDCSIRIFIIEAKKGTKINDLKPMHILLNHDGSVNYLAINSELDVLVSASQDKTCVVYNLSKGLYIRTIYHDFPVTLVALTKYGDIVSYCPENEILYLHTINGALIKKQNGIGKVTCLRVSNDGLFLILAAGNKIFVRSLYKYSLKKTNVWTFKSLVITTIELFNNDNFLVFGTKSGSLGAMIFNWGKIMTTLDSYSSNSHKIESK